MDRLQIVSAKGESFDHPLDGDSFVLGRSSKADLKLEDRRVSREHARLYREDDRWMIEDLDSQNGTFVNSGRISKPTVVGPNDVLGIPPWTLTIETEEQVPTELPETVPIAVETGDFDGSTQLFRSASEVVSTLFGDVSGLQEVGSLRTQAERLQILNEVHQALSRPLELEELFELILERAFSLLKPEEGAIFLQAPSGEYERAASRSRPGLEGPALYSRNLVEKVAEKGMAALVLDAQQDEDFDEAASILGSGVRSIVAAPLADAEGSLGMIALNSREGVGRFSEEDRDLLASLASVAALRIRNATLAEDAAKQRRLEEELALARRIQVALLPERLPEPQGYEVFAGNVPSRGVSGDYYVVVERLDGDECVFMLADVAGKGMAASLLTACLEALSAGPIHDGVPPEEICGRVSQLLYERTPPDKFATALVAILERETGKVRYASAGHNPGLLLRSSGEVLQLGTTGLPLGCLPEAEYGAEETTLEPEDTLVLYTDGIVEATDPDMEEYGLDRLTEVCLEHRGPDLDKLAAAVDTDLEDFARDVPFADDRTLVVVYRKPD
jgi:serine phosphatase RsbU (regulator of sigma subunit)